MRIRPAEQHDGPALAELASQLGYPCTEAQIVERLGILFRSAEHLVLVAEESGGEVTGWLQASMTHSLESGTRVEIRGLVVRQSHRGAGVGRQLTASAEEWARRNHVGELRVRCNVVRRHAHRFYERLGFRQVKTQSVFSKAVDSGGG